MSFFEFFLLNFANSCILMHLRHWFRGISAAELFFNLNFLVFLLFFLFFAHFLYDFEVWVCGGGNLIRHSHPDKSIDFGTPPSALSDPRQPKAIYVEKGVVFLTIKNAHICTQSVAQSAMFEGRACGTPVSKKGGEEKWDALRKNYLPFRKFAWIGELGISQPNFWKQSGDRLFFSQRWAFYLLLDKKRAKISGGHKSSPPSPFFFGKSSVRLRLFFFFGTAPRPLFFLSGGFFFHHKSTIQKKLFFSILTSFFEKKTHNDSPFFPRVCFFFRKWRKKY